MRIAFLLPRNIISGGIFTVFEHARRLSGIGHSVTIFFCDSSFSKMISDYPGLSAIKTMYLSELDCSHEFDVAVATWWETAFYVHEIKASRYVYLVQGFEEEFYAPEDIRRQFVKQTFSENFIFLTVSGALQEHLKQKYAVESKVVLNPINQELFTTITPAIAPTQAPRVLVEGDPSWSLKRISEAFEALAPFENLEVVWVSPVNCASYLWPKTRRFERLPYTLIPSVFSSCDFIIKLSSVESFARPVMEMFATGGTAIVTAFPGHEQYLRHEENALVVPIDNKRAAVEAVRRMLSEPGLIEHLKNGASKTFSNWRTIDNVSSIEKALSSNGHELISGEIIKAVKSDYLHMVASQGSACSSTSTKLVRETTEAPSQTMNSILRRILKKGAGACGLR